MKTKYQYCGPISLDFEIENDVIVSISFVKPSQKTDIQEQSSLEKQIYTQFEAYFAGKLHQFDLPIRLSGTPFQQKVYTEMLQVPYGEVVSYSELAERIGHPKAARAVGMANHVNPLPIIVPCHRIVGKNGSLTGFAGGLDIKQFLIDLERNNSK
ncbi:MAG: methylated-DNA--[protein]-cysteine S-methyltransferase [Candidatus Cloacimonadaceae bacterium]|nr:methylated-DNA--[protein]-cysteine S-methyltransferase [Candidatus Cloacimonadaceae bacterium]